jgi:predicted MPP superfamily phosphohydrolase
LEERVIEEACRLAPDLVVWTGDYVQPRLAPTRRETEARFRETLVRHPIRARFGSYAVRGDVDIDWPQVVAGTEMVPLSGTSLRLDLPGGRTLRLIGLHPGTSRGGDTLALSQALGDEGLPIHVSAGIGMERGTAPQVRFLCPPEICLLDIRY